MDLQVEIEPVEFDAMANHAPGEGSETIGYRALDRASYGTTY